MHLPIKIERPPIEIWALVDERTKTYKVQLNTAPNFARIVMQRKKHLVSGLHIISGKKTTSVFGEDFIFWRSPVFGRKKTLNFWFRPEKAFEFRRRPFSLRPPGFGWKKNLNFWFRPETAFEFRWSFFLFFWDHLIFTEKSLQSNSRLMKIWVKFIYGWIKLTKKPLPLQNLGYTPDDLY